MTKTPKTTKKRRKRKTKFDLAKAFASRFPGQLMTFFGD